MVRAAMGWPCLYEDPPARARVNITQHRKRLLDTDNLYSSLKPVLDALIRNQLIRDDSPQSCVLEAKQVKASSLRTVIEIEECQ